MSNNKRLSRPYARAIAGIPSQMHFDPEKRTFSLTYPITFGQTLWKIGISSVGTTIDEKNLIRNFENPTADSDSPYPITQGLTKFQSFMTNDRHLLI